MDWLKPPAKRRWSMDHAVEASLFAELLRQEEIPYSWIPATAAAFGTVEDSLQGHGWFETLPDFEQALDRLYQDFKASK